MNRKNCIVLAILIAVGAGLYMVRADMNPIATGVFRFGPPPTWTRESAYPERWTVMRTVTAADTPLTKDTKVWNTTGFYPLKPEWRTAIVGWIAYGDGTGAGDPNGGTFSWRAYLRSEFGPAQLVAYGTAAVGDMHLSHNPETGAAYWGGVVDPNYAGVDTIVVTDDSTWRTGVSSTNDPNGLANLMVNRSSEWAIRIEHTSLVNVTRLYPIIKGYR